MRAFALVKKSKICIREGGNMLENGMVAGYGYEEPLREPRMVGQCKYKYCREELYEGEGYELYGHLYCSTGCIGDHFLEEGEAVDLSS